jgi:hypothetical protein
MIMGNIAYSIFWDCGWEGRLDDDYLEYGKVQLNQPGSVLIGKCAESTLSNLEAWLAELESKITAEE